MQQVWRPAPASVSRDSSGAVQFNAGGYGFGLRVSQTCAFRHVVAHSGGLPGFGSVMTLAAGVRRRLHRLRQPHLHRVGAHHRDRLRRAGEKRGAEAAVAEAVAGADRGARRGVEARRAVGRSRREAASRPTTSSSIRPSDRRRAEIEALRAKVGACTPGSGFDSIENALRGQWTLNCERGKLQVAITLAPTMPPRVQYLDVRPAPAAPIQQNVCP